MNSKNGTIVTQNEAGISLITGSKMRRPTRYQSITQAGDPHSGARVRIWRDHNELPTYNDVELQLTISKIPGHASMEDVVNILSSIDRVTRVELVDPEGNGAVVEFAREEH